MRADCHINTFKPNNFRVVRNLYVDKGSVFLTRIEYKIISSSCWNEKHQPLSSHMTKDKHTGRNHLA